MGTLRLPRRIYNELQRITKDLDTFTTQPGTVGPLAALRNAYTERYMIGLESFGAELWMILERLGKTKGLVDTDVCGMLNRLEQTPGAVNEVQNLGREDEFARQFLKMRQVHGKVDRLKNGVNFNKYEQVHRTPRTSRSECRGGLQLSSAIEVDITELRSLHVQKHGREDRSYIRRVDDDLPVDDTGEVPVEVDAEIPDEVPVEVHQEIPGEVPVDVHQEITGEVPVEERKLADEKVADDLLADLVRYLENLVVIDKTDANMSLSKFARSVDLTALKECAGNLSEQKRRADYSWNIYQTVEMEWQTIRTSSPLRHSDAMVEDDISGSLMTHKHNYEWSANILRLLHARTALLEASVLRHNASIQQSVQKMTDLEEHGVMLLKNTPPIKEWLD